MKKILLSVFLTMILCTGLAVSAIASETKTVTTKGGNMTILNVLFETNRTTGSRYDAWFNVPVYWIPDHQTARVTFNNAREEDVFALFVPTISTDGVYMDGYYVDLPLEDDTFTLQVWMDDRDRTYEEFYSEEYLTCIEYNNEYICIGFVKEGTQPPISAAAIPIDEDTLDEVEAVKQYDEIPASSPLRSGSLFPLTVEPPSEWATEHVNLAITEGLVPEDLRGSYTQAITRVEFCALAAALYEAEKNTEIEERVEFSDTDDVNVQKMAALGVVSGIGDNKFDPDAKLTREQAAAMLARLASVLDMAMPEEAPTFADNDNISPWAFDSVGFVQAAHIMSGVGDNIFAPLSEYTREQSIATMLRLFYFMK